MQLALSAQQVAAICGPRLSAVYHEWRYLPTVARANRQKLVGVAYLVGYWPLASKHRYARFTASLGTIVDEAHTVDAPPPTEDVALAACAYIEAEPLRAARLREVRESFNSAVSRERMMLLADAERLRALVPVSGEMLGYVLTGSTKHFPDDFTGFARDYALMHARAPHNAFGGE